jgi:transposase
MLRKESLFAILCVVLMWSNKSGHINKPIYVRNDKEYFMSTKRTSYTEEFKRSAVSLVIDQGYTIQEASDNLGINSSMLAKWKKKYSASPSPKSASASHQELESELKRLRKENHRLKQERDILKKAAAFFAADSGNVIK